MSPDEDLVRLRPHDPAQTVPDWARRRQRIRERLLAPRSDARQASQPGRSRSLSWETPAAAAIAVSVVVGAPTAMIAIDSRSPSDIVGVPEPGAPASTNDPNAPVNSNDDTEPPGSPPGTTVQGLPAGPLDVSGWGMLQQLPDGPIQLCVGGVLESYPPQCPATVPVSGVSWEQINWGDSSAGTTWADARVTGTWRDGVLEIAEVTDPAEEPQSEYGLPAVELPAGPSPSERDLLDGQKAVMAQHTELGVLSSGVSAQGDDRYLSIGVFLATDEVVARIRATVAPELADWVIVFGQFQQV